jgi:hypothetical protein
MDRVIDFEGTIQREVEAYSGPTIKGRTFFVNDKEQQLYAVLILPDYPPRFQSGIMVMARLLGDYVIIDEDTTDRPLVKELVRAGIPREQIILAYAGESLPEAK